MTDTSEGFETLDLERAASMGETGLAVAEPEGQDVSPAEVERRFRAQAMAALRRVMQEIASTLDLDHILTIVLNEAIRCTEADAGVVAIFGESGPEVRVSRGYGDDDGDAIDRLVQDPEFELARRLEAGEMVHVTGSPGEEGDVPGWLETEAMVIAPVFYEQRLAAALLLQSANPEAFTPPARDFIAGLAGQTAIAVGNAQRYQDQLQRGELMRQRAEQMSLLLEISRTTRSDRPLEDILLDVAYAVQEGTGFDLVLISVLEGTTLRRVAGAGIPLTELEKRKGIRLPWDRVRRLCQERFRLGQCYYIPEQHRGLTEGLDVFVPEPDLAPTGSGRWHNEDIFFVPLRDIAGDIIGIMSVDRPRNGLAPTPITAEIVEVFAAQVAQTIENHRLVENLRRQITTLQLFNELNRSITTKLDLPLVLNTVVQSVTNLLGYDFSTIFLRDRQKQHFVPLASSGYTLDFLEDAPMTADAGFIRDVVRTAMPLVVEDVPNDPRYGMLRIPVGSSIAVPLGADGEMVGILTADRKEPGDFTPVEVATLTALAEQVSVAVENARLFEEVKRLNEELEARVAERTQELAEALERLRLQRDRSEVLYHIASELVASLDMDRVLSQALMLLQRAVHASRSSVVLLDHSTGQLVYRAAIGHTQPIPPGGKPAPFGREEGLVGWALSKREALIIPDTSKETRFSFEGLEPAHSAMAVPILGGAGEALGVILLQSNVVDAFDETQLRLVEAAAVQLGNALNNAELYRLIREQAERLGAMLRAQQIDAAKNQAILEDIADGVMVADASGRVILFNAAAERIMSISRDQVLGQFQDEILGLYGSETQEWVSQIAAWREAPREHGPGAYLARRLEVGRHFVSIHLAPVISESDEFLGVVSVFRDVTAEIEADRAKSDFVSTVSHELRTPMTSIVGYVDLMLNGMVGELSQMQLEFLRKVKASADRLTNLVDDLLDISRIEQGRIELMRRPLAIEELIAQVVDLVAPKTEEKGQDLTIVLPEKLPKVYGDSDRLAQILTNLVSNAYKYTQVGGKITIHAYVREAMMHVAVADTGIGIAPENQKKIFERFYRVEDDPAVYEVSGTGLGLAITLSLIQMHGGSIWLESELGKGSIFTFSVPLAKGESTEDVGELPLSLLTSPTPSVLVVEDDTDVARLLRVTLEAEEMKVFTATSGEEALRMARQKLPDFISLDIRLPDLDGWEVLQLLKRETETADIPVVIVSVVADRERGLALGALEFLSKPIDAQRFVDIVKRTLQRQHVVVVANSNRELLNRLRTALQIEGVAVRTTMRGERALRLAQELEPMLVVLDPDIQDLDAYQFVDRLRRDPRTAEVPVIVAGGAGRRRVSTIRLSEKLQSFAGVTCVSGTSSPEQLTVEALTGLIFDALAGNGPEKECEHGQDSDC